MNVINRSVLFLAIFLAPSSAWSATKSIGASKDSTIFSDQTGRSGGGSPGFFVGNNMMGNTRRGLIAFDIAASVPAGSVVTGAQLTLNQGNSATAGNQAISVYRLTKDWGEGAAGSTQTTIGGSGGGFTATAGDATWNEAALSSTSWTTPGGDYDPTAKATTSGIGTSNGPVSWSSAALAADVQSWLDTPASNFGWILLNSSQSGMNTARGFFSREAGTGATDGIYDTALQPLLTITYIPEPSASALILAAGPVVCFLRRR